MMLSKQACAELDREINKYPTGQSRAAVMAALRIAQEERGWINNDLIMWIADYLSLEPIQVAEVATFYSMYDLEPVGGHKISVCTNVSCMLRGSDGIVRHLEKRLGIELGETTEDGRFTLREAECLAACGGAPMMQIGKIYYENLTQKSVDMILDNLE